jgi:hypothetical protein
MIPTAIETGRAPGTLVAVLYSDAGRELEAVALDTDRLAQAGEVAIRHAIACSEGGGVVVIYDGDSGALVMVLGSG